MFCRSCGKQIEPDAHFCRYCGKSQEDVKPGPASPASASASGTAIGPAAASSRTDRGFEERLRQLFPRHHLQDEFMHLATIVAFVIAVIGFIFGMTSLWAFGVTWLLFAIALLLFLMLRESTLSHVRDRDSHGRPRGREAGSKPGRRTAPEGATAESSPPPSPPGA